MASRFSSLIIYHSKHGSKFLQIFMRCIVTEVNKTMHFSDCSLNIKSNIHPLRHVPVMPKEVVHFMDPKDGQIFIDMTFGSGGHSEHLLQSANDVTVYALDRDPAAFGCATALANQYQGKRIFPMLGRFSDIDELLGRCNIKEGSIDGILFDFGASSLQMDDPSRGFSLSCDGPLDMRMDGNRFPNTPTAYDVINHTDEQSLARILKVYGEEAMAKSIARVIAETKYSLQDIRTTLELARIVATVANRRTDKMGRSSHAATKTFQALRIFINNELNEINYGIEAAHRYLRPGGRLVALAFHSLEDRIVKRHIKGIDMDEIVSSNLSQKYKNCSTWHRIDDLKAMYSNNWTPINRQVITPRLEEVTANPRSRSAKLRAAIKN